MRLGSLPYYGTLYIKGRPIFHDRVTYSKEIQYYSLVLTTLTTGRDVRKGWNRWFPTTNQQLKTWRDTTVILRAGPVLCLMEMQLESGTK